MQQRNQEFIEDEISLVDLAMVLIKRKWVVVVVFIAALLLAVGKIVASGDSGDSAPSYKYSTVLELGSVLTPNGVSAVDSPENVQAKLEARYIAQANEALALDGEDLSVSVVIPNKSNLVVLESTSRNEAAQGIVALHKRIASVVVEEMQTSETSVGDQLVSPTRILGETKVVKVAKLSSDDRSGLILTLGAVLGLMLGVFAAFFVEFLSNFRGELRRRAAAE